MPGTLSSERSRALYQSTVQEAARRGVDIMGKLVAAARLSLQTREAASRDLHERDSLAGSARQLRQWEPELCKRYPRALSEAFVRPAVPPKSGNSASADLQFDELELMDEVQVLTSVALARTQQVALLAAEASLAELNTLICSTLGLGAVKPESNPLRPEIFVGALKGVIEQTQVPGPTQLDWLGAMGVALGQELRSLYMELSTKLRGEGVVGAGYAVLQTPAGHGIGRGIAQDVHHGSSTPESAASSVAAPVRAASARDSSLLTLDRLRQLLTGELDRSPSLSAVEAFAQRFAQEFENGPEPTETAQTDFDATVPAALEALKEMHQVDDMVQRLEQRRGTSVLPVADGDASVDAVRSRLRSQVRGVAQVLSLEVITLLVENIATDARLLEPVQQLIRRLEPALLRLSLVDARLFTDKQHPARLLVQEITHRSMAYATAQTTGFREFMQGLERVLAPLFNAPIESAEPFVQVLRQLQDAWQRAEKQREQQRAQTVEVLRHAEQRNLLAEKIAKEIDGHPDAGLVPDVVMDFLCGPWAQVVAQARITGGSGSSVADKYQALISALLWSTHPKLNRTNYGKLTRLVPLLLSTLREGLEIIGYPATKTSAFLEALMGLHQLAFRAAQKPEVAAREPEPEPKPHTSARVMLLESGDPWVGPQEAEASNFMELPDLAPQVSAPAAASGDAAAPSPQRTTTTHVADLPAQPQVADLTLGSWVEMMVNGQWIRTQLTWASPHGTLFLFTSVFGTTQSMTRRSRDKMVEAGDLRIISGQPVVEGALNAVAQQAMRNSVDSTL